MKLSTTLFASSFTIAVAAGLVQLDAGPDADGPARKPVIGEATIGGHKLAVTLDRERVPAGEAVKLAIVGKEGGAGDKLRVAVLEQTGSPMSRSMPPPREVFHQDVTIAQDGALSLPIPLRGTKQPDADAADPIAIAGRVTQFTVVVSAIDSSRDSDQPAYLPVFAYQPEAYRLEVEPIGAAEPGQPVDVQVKVTSLVDKPLRGLTVGASSELANLGDPVQLKTLAPRATTIVHLKGTRVATGSDAPAMVQAYGYADYGGTAAAWATFDAAKLTPIARASEGANPMLLGLN